MDTGDYREMLLSALEEARDIFRASPEKSAKEVLESLSPETSSLIGGDTTCVEVEHGDTHLVLDLGTGARRLGYDLMRRKFTGELHILMTHTHWDHIQGWPFFAAGYHPAIHVTFHSGLEDCEQRFSFQQKFSYFPISFENMPSRKSFHHFSVGDSFSIGDLEIQTRALIHPGGSVAYRIETKKSVFIFATDIEIYGEDSGREIESFRSFFEGADLLIMDGQYSPEEAAQRVGWGHTAARMAIESATAWGVRKLVLTHHEPAHSDPTIRRLFQDARDYQKSLERPDATELCLGRQGDEFHLP